MRYAPRVNGGITHLAVYSSQSIHVLLAGQQVYKICGICGNWRGGGRKIRCTAVFRPLARQREDLGPAFEGRYIAAYLG